MQEADRGTASVQASTVTALVPWLFLLCSTAEQAATLSSHGGKALLKAAMKAVHQRPAVQDHGMAIDPTALLHCCPLAAGRCCVRLAGDAGAS